MNTRNVVLTDDQDLFLRELVASGRYQNTSEAMRAGLRLLAHEEFQICALRERLTLGVDQARAGERAAGTGAEAVRDAFADARRRRADG